MKEYIYSIPLRDKFIVYKPLARLAFMANQAMVNFIDSLQSGEEDSWRGENGEAHHFLKTIGFFDPAPPPHLLLEERPFKPSIAVLFTTTACNFRCIYCYASGGENSVQTLPFKIGCRAIDHVCRNAQENGEDHFTIAFHGGGEPTLAKDNFEKLIEYSQAKGYPCDLTVTTNGHWTDDQRDWVLTNLNSVSLSLDGTSSVHDRQRPLASGQGTHKIVFRTIREMDKQSFPYGIRMTVIDESIDQLPESIDFLCRETGCRTFQVEPAFDHGRARLSGSALSNDDRFAEALMEAYGIAASFGRHLYYSGARPQVITTSFCQALDRALIVSPDGLLTSCYEIYSSEHTLAPDFFFGSLSEDGRLAIDHEVRQKLNGKLKERRGLCTDCFCYWHCAGDCPSKTVTPEKDGHLQFGRRCDLNRTITRELLTQYINDAGGIWHGESMEDSLFRRF